MMIKFSSMQHSRGFSLIELIVVVGIIGILAAVAVPVYRDYQARAKIATVVNSLEGLMKQALQKYDAIGIFPTTISGITGGPIVPYSGITYVNNAVFDLYNNTPYFLVKYNDYPTTGATEGWIGYAARRVNNVWTYNCGAWHTFGDAHAFGDASKTALLPKSCSSPSVYTFIIS